MFVYSFVSCKTSFTSGFCLLLVGPRVFASCRQAARAACGRQWRWERRVGPGPRSQLPELLQPGHREGAAAARQGRRFSTAAGRRSRSEISNGLLATCFTLELLSVLWRLLLSSLLFSYNCCTIHINVDVDHLLILHQNLSGYYGLKFTLHIWLSTFSTDILVQFHLEQQLVSQIRVHAVVLVALI